MTDLCDQSFKGFFPIQTHHICMSRRTFLMEEKNRKKNGEEGILLLNFFYFSLKEDRKGNKHGKKFITAKNIYKTTHIH